jgi:hypothetical protein
MGAAVAALAWAAWALVLFAVLASRPFGLTTVRVAAPAAFVGALLLTEPAALAVSGVALAAVLLPETAAWFAQGAAYGDERRLLLRTPPALLAGPAPLAALLVAAGVVTGPLLLADEQWAAGALATVAGLAVAARLSRSLHALSRRWLILVPGGVVVHDPLTLADPVLLPRETLRRIGPGDDTAPAVDLRLGARAGTLAFDLTEPVPLAVVERDRKLAEVVRGDRVLVSVARPGAVLEAARDRRLPVG